jgi:hypothetical protein
MAPGSSALSVVRLTLLACGVCASAAPAAVKQMFVTSTSGPGQLQSWAPPGSPNGIGAGDAICQERAQSAGLPNPGGYRAWLSNLQDDAYCRVAGFAGRRASSCGQPTLPDAGPWTRTDGKPFSADLLNLTAPLGGVTYWPALVDETGTTVSGVLGFFTGTSADGTSLDNHDCSDFTSSSSAFVAAYGVESGGVTNWTDFGDATCAASLRLLCFETGPGDPVTIPESEGALAFATSIGGNGALGSWPAAGGAGGLAAGDAICRSRARTGHLPAPDSFVAWLSSTPDGVDAVDRLPAGVAFKRLDGVEIAADRDHLTSLDPAELALAAPLDVTELGTYRSRVFWTGTAASGSASASDCAGWTAGSAADHATIGLATEARGFWTEYLEFPCSNAFQALACFSTQPILFADGFESGDASRWSVTLP